MSVIKSLIKRTARMVLPRPILSVLASYRTRTAVRKNVKHYTEDCTTQEIFTKIYNENTWGQSSDPSQKYHSGPGSHDPTLVNAYVKSLDQFLRSFDEKPDVVDLGCGDFFIGSQIRGLCGNYTACDIVEPLIALNREKYKSLNVDFRVLDLTKDSLPEGDILFIRQVLQHLSNKQIKKALPQIAKRYKYFVLTEHLAATDSFVPNLDLPTGPSARVEINSGIVVTSRPFNLKVREERVLCEVAAPWSDEGIWRTILYKLH
jgi:SAM-dependent methyltransferase